MMNDDLLIHRATIYDVARTVGVGGSAPTSRTLRASGVNCRMSALSTSERELAGAPGGAPRAKVYFPPGQAVALGDVVVIDSVEHEVVKPPVVPSVPIYKMVIVEEWHGGA